jgi:hypothetical protein
MAGAEGENNTNLEADLYYTDIELEKAEKKKQIYKEKLAVKLKMTAAITKERQKRALALV